MSITLTPLAPFPCPPTYLLTVDSAKVLLDAGAFDASPELSQNGPRAGSKPEPDSDAASQAAATAEYLERLRQLAPDLNLVVLSHPLLSSVGLLPWLRARCGLRCPVYATLPTREMGRWAVEEWVEARSEAERNPRRNKAMSKQQAAAAAGKKRRTTKPGDAAAATTKAVDDSRGEQHDDIALAVSAEDPWDAVWKLSPTEIREAFLAVNAVRWTQPVHLGGKCLACCYAAWTSKVCH